MDINFFAIHRYGNIEVHIAPLRGLEDGVVVRQLFVSSFSGQYNQGCVLHLLKMPLKSQ